MNVHHKHGIASGLKYKDYAVLIAHIDAGNSTAVGPDSDGTASLLRPSEAFAGQCCNIRKSLHEAMGLCAQQGHKEYVPEIDHFLYNPASFVAFGDTDSIIMAAVDEFEPAAALSSLVEAPVRQTCLALCPELTKLGLATKEYRGMLCEFQDIYNDPLLAAKRSGGEGIASSEHFLRQRPLLVITYFKMNGTSVLGPGLLIQEYAYKVVARRIRSTLKWLSDHIRELKDIIPGGQDDIDSFRCLFLDPQGWSDMATVMFCKNYSVAATVIAALRFITLGDLYRASREEAATVPTAKGITLEEAVEAFGLHRALASLAGNAAAGQSLLAGNHLFLSTYTCPGIYDKAFAEEHMPPRGYTYDYNGIVIPSTNLSLCSGHLLDFREAFRKRGASTDEANKQASVSGKYVWFMSGHHESVHQQLVDETRDIDNAVSVRNLVRQIKDIRATAQGEPLGTHILKISTTLRIPLPIIESPDIMAPVRSNEHIELRIVLGKLRESLFLDPQGVLSLPRIRNSMSVIRLPSPLSTAIEYLYADYANYLTDPFLFEAVLDVHDIFIALNRLITETLPRSLRDRLVTELNRALGPQKVAELHLQDELFTEHQEQLSGVLKGNVLLRNRLDSICRSFLTADDLDDLAVLVDAMQNSLANRTQITFREAGRWNVTVDARGVGLDRILSAADTPLKCGLGMLRRVMTRLVAEKPAEQCPLSGDIWEESRRRFKIGGASKVSYHPRAFSQRLLVKGSMDVFFASVDLNIANLTRPRSFYVHLHEAAHMICDLLRDAQSCGHADYPCARADACCHKKCRCASDPRNEVLLERYREVFAEMLTHRFIFGEDSTIFFRNYIANYSLDPISCGPNDDQTFLRMLEVFIRGFLASDPFRAGVQYMHDPPSQLGAEAKQKALSRFWGLVNDAGWFVWDFERLWYGDKKDEVKEYVEQELVNAYKEAYYPVCCMWRDIRWIYETVVEETYPSSQDTQGLLSEIRDAFEDGRPLVRVKYKDFGKRGGQVADDGLDPLFVMCNLLGLHISRLFDGEIDTQKDMLCLPRRTNGSPDLDLLPGKKKWNCRVLDRNFNGIVAPVPSVRSESMRERAVIIKTLWDISTTLRARQLKRILECTWPDAFLSSES